MKYITTLFKTKKARRRLAFFAAAWILKLAVVLLLKQVITQKVNAQNNVTLSGYVKDAETGETLIGAYVYDANNKAKGTSTNLYGFFSLTLTAGDYTIESSFIGYDAKQITLNLKEDEMINLELNPSGVVIEEVVVSARRKDENVESTDMGRVELSVEKIKSLPALMGEVDVIRTMQLLPGVMSSGELSSGLYVRGGGPDQNLIILDEAVVYNTGHLFGFFSIFNSDAIKNTTLHKGSMPAEYGGRLSSVLDISMKEGNDKKFTAEGGIGLISSRLTIQGPIQKNKSSFLISGRRTYADLLARPYLKSKDLGGNGYYFYDLNVKANYRFSDKDRIFLSGYFGRDVLNYRAKDGFTFDMPWGNATTTLRWNHLFSNKLFMNVSAIYNAYDFEVHAAFDDFKTDVISGVRDWNAKIDFDYFPSTNHTIKFGANYTHHAFTPYTVDAQVGDATIQTDSLTRKYAHEAAIYVQDDMIITDKLKANVGLRASLFQQIGPFNQPVYNEEFIPIDTINYSRGEAIATYGGIEPRISLRYAINGHSSLKGAFAYTNQYIHLVSNSTSTLPTDLWVPSSDKVRPQRGLQYSLGYFHNFADDQYEVSAEVYYKTMHNQIEFGESYVPELNVDVENNFVFGKGKSYGMELFLQKRRGKLTGWVGYTLSRTTRSFPDINDGVTFPAKYDRTHDLSIVANYDLNEKLKLGGTYVFGTGQNVTLPNSFYFVEGWIYYEYMDRNSYRLPPYHRFDFSLTLTPNRKPDKKFHSEWVFSFYNVYNRKNPFFIYAIPEINDDTSIDIKLKQVSLFAIVPSVTWNFKF